MQHEKNFKKEAETVGEGIGFERIRRITGYLVGTLDRFNNAKRAEEKKSLLHKYFSGDLLDEILIWKDQRNRLIHALLKQQLAHNEVSILAAQGNELVKALRSRVSSFNRASEKAGAN